MLTFGHIVDKDIPKRYGQPEAYEAAGEIVVEAPYGEDQFGQPCQAQCFITCEKEYGEDDDFVDVYPYHQFEKLAEGYVACTHEVARDEKEAVDSCLAPNAN